MKLSVVIFVVTATSLTMFACDKPRERDSAPVAADNSQTNERDRKPESLLPTDQGESQADRDISARVRRDVVADDNLGMQAKNVKIVTRDGAVTLRGVVRTPAERALVATYAKKAPGVREVNDLLEVTAN